MAFRLKNHSKHSRKPFKLFDVSQVPTMQRFMTPQDSSRFLAQVCERRGCATGEGARGVRPQGWQVKHEKKKYLDRSRRMSRRKANINTLKVRCAGTQQSKFTHKKALMDLG
eukprot:5173106-Pleurochrysis_carterae.AAC.1